MICCLFGVVNNYNNKRRCFVEKFLKFLGYYWMFYLVFPIALLSSNIIDTTLYAIGLLFYIIGYINQTKDELLEAINNNKKEK